MAKSLMSDAFHQAAGTANHGMYSSTPSSIQSNPVIGAAKSAIRAAARAPGKLVDTTIGRMQEMDKARAARDEKIMASVGFTPESYKKFTDDFNAEYAAKKKKK